MDNTVGDLRKRSKTIDATTSKFKYFEVPASVARAANAERFELAA